MFTVAGSRLPTSSWVLISSPISSWVLVSSPTSPWVHVVAPTSPWVLITHKSLGSLHTSLWVYTFFGHCIPIGNWVILGTCVLVNLNPTTFWVLIILGSHQPTDLWVHISWVTNNLQTSGYIQLSKYSFPWTSGYPCSPQTPGSLQLRTSSTHRNLGPSKPASRTSLCAC